MTIRWSMVPEIWCATEFFVILSNFLPFYPSNNPKNQNLEKIKKKHLEILPFYTSAPKIMIIILYYSWDMARDGCNFYFSFWTIFCPFTPLTTQKIKIFKKWKKLPEISSFYNLCTKKYDHMMHGSWDIARNRRTDGQTEKVTCRGGCPS